MKGNSLIDVFCAESWNPRIFQVFGTICHQIQAVGTEGRDLHVVFLDLIVAGERLQDGTQLPPFQANMYEMTSLITTAPCTVGWIPACQEL